MSRIQTKRVHSLEEPGRASGLARSYEVCIKYVGGSGEGEQGCKVRQGRTTRAALATGLTLVGHRIAEKKILDVMQAWGFCLECFPYLKFLVKSASELFDTDRDGVGVGGKEQENLPQRSSNI